MLIRHAIHNDQAEWLRMRSVLWPDCPLADHRTEMAEQFADEKSLAVFVAELYWSSALRTARAVERLSPSNVGATATAE